MTPVTEEQTEEQTVEQVVDRVVTAVLGTFDVLSLHLGDRLGWYRQLTAGPATPTELAATAGHPRYALEWCRQQAATGFLTRLDGERYELAPGVAEVLTDPHSLNHLAPLARLVAGLTAHVPEILEAYRSGGGVGWADLGEDVRLGQADVNRPWFEDALAPTLATVPAVQDLLTRPGARLADIGCGAGWSAIGLARAHPGLQVLAIDIDPASVAMAADNVTGAGLDDRVEVRLADAATLAGDGPFDLVTAFECVHDLPRPVEVLGAAREVLAPHGAVLVCDEAVAEEPPPPGDVVERLMYGYSLFACLPDSMSAPDSVATGTVMRPSTLARYAEQAGFSRVEELPVTGFGFFRFTLLRP